MKKLILGNIETMDEANPKAKAIVVNNGIIEYVGDEIQARKLIDEGAEVLDYKDKHIYPGFIEPHCHGIFAGSRAIGQADLSSCLKVDYDEYERIIRQYIKDHPNNEFYLAAGWNEDERKIDHTYLDSICSDKPLVLNSAGGHSSLLNKKAMEHFGLNKDYVVKYGKERVHVDENGELTGYVCEEPAIALLKELAPGVKDAKEDMLAFQDIALSKGYTACGDAGAELICKVANTVYKELQDEHKLKLRTYSYSLIKDNEQDIDSAINNVLKLQKEVNGEYYEIIGLKVFLDGVAEARTSWTIDEYSDEKGYFGIQRFNDENKMVELITKASKNHLSVHAHSEGDGATRFMTNCILKSQAITHDLDQRNVIAHLHYVKDEELDNIAASHSIAAVAPLWTAKFPGAYENEVKSFGEERALKAYPIKSFVDRGATIVYHSDYPISPILDVTRSLYKAELRALPEKEFGGLKSQRGKEECVDRMTSLKALTINSAYALKQEKKMGSLEKGKIANMTVYDGNLLDEDLEKVIKTKLLTTIVDGEIVYQN